MIQHGHLLDVARTWLFNMKVPKHFWSDAIFTSCHLINRMPSAILNHRSPFSLYILIVHLFILLVCLVVSPLFMYLILTKTSYPPGLVSVFSLGTLVLRKAIAVTVLGLVDTLWVLMLSSSSPVCPAFVLELQSVSLCHDQEVSTWHHLFVWDEITLSNLQRYFEQTEFLFACPSVSLRVQRRYFVSLAMWSWPWMFCF